jgi:formylglycine-generating enzyme required for sulfatase activity
MIVVVLLYLSGCTPISTSDVKIEPSSTIVPATPVNPTETATQIPATPTQVPATPTAITPTATQTPPTEILIPPEDASLGDIWTRTIDGMAMIFIPAGEFLMGSTEENPCAHKDELHLHTVYLDNFWIDRTEVSSGQYKQCVEAGACPPPGDCGWGEATYGDDLKEDHPIVCVDWDEARTYCDWIGGKLPTEAQWEKAARGTDQRAYPWGEEFDQNKCNSKGGEINATMPVGSYSPIGDSPYGLADMSGNVLEWVIDWYDIDYYPKSSSLNPSGPIKGERRSLRGGSFYTDLCNARTTYRYYDVPYGVSPGVGFRCVIPARE